MSDSLRPHGPWNSPGQNTGVGSLSLLQGNFPTQGSNPGLLHCRQVLYQLSNKGSARILEWVAYPFSSGSSQPRNWTRVSCIAGGFFTTELSGKHKCLVNIGWMNEQLNQYAPKYVTWVLKHWSWFPISNYLQRSATHSIMEEYFKEDHLNIVKYFSSNTVDPWTMKRVQGAVHLCSWKSMDCYLCLKNKGIDKWLTKRAGTTFWIELVLLPGGSHGQRSLVGCSPWDCWESGKTDRLPFHFSLSCVGEGNGNPLQYSCLENPRDGGAWWAAVYGVAQSRTRLKRISSSSSRAQIRRRQWHPTPVLLPGGSHGWRSLEGCSPWGC